MEFICDFHIHSKYSRAVSRDMAPENLDKWAKIKGIHILGIGDFTHPAWFKEIKQKLEPAEPGLFVLKKQYRLDSPGKLCAPRSSDNAGEMNGGADISEPRFILTTEISSIYTKNDKGRRVHNLIFMPSIEAVEKLNAHLNMIGNLKSDGRPILGLDSKELLKICLNVAEEEMFFVPAHAWTPWFSVFGSKSGFDSIEECFDEYSKYIYAAETGLSCYDSETELLTEKGWQSFSKITYADKICTLNPDTEMIEYQKPKKVYRSKYQGKMYRLKTKRVDLLVTPNHNLLYTPADFRTKRPYRLKEARELFRKSKILRKDGVWEGETPSYFVLPEVKIRHGSRSYSGFRTKAAKKFPMETWLKFFGFWIAEGWTTKGKNGHYAVCIANQNHELMTEMKYILESFGYTVFWDRKTTNTIRVRDYQLFDYLQKFGKSAQKHIPLEVKRLSKRFLELFLEYYLKGDGHVYGRNGKGCSATTISTRLRDDLQEIALKIGISAYYKLHNKKGTLFISPSQKKEYRQSADSWNIYFIRQNRHAIIPSEIKKYRYEERWVNYDGMVHCVSVPNRVVYIRRNGIPLWCGNSDPAMNWRLSKLDNISLISNSDSHSLMRLGRESNVLNIDSKDLSYDSIINAIKSKDPSRFLYTVEFFPEEGKYHFDGHRLCKVSMNPSESKKHNSRCPKCSKPVTLGVLYRVEELADRDDGFIPKERVPFKNMVPLDQIIADALGMGTNTKAVWNKYKELIDYFHNEFYVQFKASEEQLRSITIPEISEAIIRVRNGKLHIAPGYDGEFGKIEIFTAEERSSISKQAVLF